MHAFLLACRDMHADIELLPVLTGYVIDSTAAVGAFAVNAPTASRLPWHIAPEDSQSYASYSYAHNAYRITHALRV